jgi:hypothetical protein
MRIRVLSSCLAFSAMAIISTGAAAQAATLSGSGGNNGGDWGYGNGYQTCPPGEQYSYQKECCKPTPPPPCQCHTPSPTPPGWQYVVPPSPVPSTVYTTAPVTTVTVTATASPPASATAVAPVVESSSPVPSGPANTGGGMPGGSDIPLAAGGGAVALIAAPLGLIAFRRWRQTRGAA